MNNELDGFDLIASHYSNDILETLTALNETKTSNVEINAQGKRFVSQKSEKREGYLILLDLLLQNFLSGDFFVSLLWPATYPESEWIYAYSRNQTLLEVPLEELQRMDDLRISYV